MAALVLLGVFMAGLAVYFWKIELMPWLDNMYRPQLSKWLIIRIFQKIYAFIYNLLRLFTDGKFLFIDIFITFISVSFLGFGDAVSGGILGLTISNFISILLIWIMCRQNHTSILRTIFPSKSGVH